MVCMKLYLKRKLLIDFKVYDTNYLGIMAIMGKTLYKFVIVYTYYKLDKTSKKNLLSFYSTMYHPALVGGN